MAQKSTEAKRISPKKLQKAKDGLTALSLLTDYNPQRAEFNQAARDAADDNLTKANKAELAAETTLAAARDAAAKAEWDAYNFMLGAGEQVMGQYGSDSDQYASLGYKKKSEYKKAPGKGKGKGGGGTVG